MYVLQNAHFMYKCKMCIAERTLNMCYSIYMFTLHFTYV